MAYEINVTAAHKVFYDTDNTVIFLAYDGEPTTAQILAGDAVPLDVTGYELTWVLRKTTKSVTPLIEKTIGTGIVIAGVFNASASLNTQQVEVTIEDTDTYDPNGSPVVHIKPGSYVHALKRTGDSVEKILAYGTFELLQAAAWE